MTDEIDRATVERIAARAIAMAERETTDPLSQYAGLVWAIVKIANLHANDHVAYVQIMENLAATLPGTYFNGDEGRFDDRAQA